MTQQELIDRQRGSEKSVTAWAGMFVIGGSSCLFILVSVLSRFDDHKNTGIDTLYAALLLILVVAQFGILFWMIRRDTNRFDLRCSGCKKPLLGPLGQVAVATGRCGHCGIKLFELPDDPRAS